MLQVEKGSTNRDPVYDELNEFIEQLHPPIEIRKKLDYEFTFDGTVFILFDIHPFPNNKSRMMKSPIAKARFIRREMNGICTG